MQNNQISLFTKPSTSADDLSDMDLKLKVLNRIHLNKTHPTNQKLYDTLYESIIRILSLIMRGRKGRKDERMLNRPNEGWFTKKSGSANAMRRTTWFDLLLKSNIDQNEDHILGPYIVAITKKLKELIQKDKLTIADLEGARLEKLKQQYRNDVELEYHVDQLKAAMLSEGQWNNNEGIEDRISERWSKEVHRYQIEAPNGIHHWDDARQDFFKAKINNITPGKVYSDKKIISVVRVFVKRKWGYGFLSSIVVRRSDKQEYTFSYANLHRLSLNDIEDIVEDLQLGVESYQRTLNLTKPKIYFEGVDDRIPYTMSGVEKGVVYLNKHNRRSQMKLNEVHKFCDGRDWDEKDVKRSKEMLDKIDQVMKRREQLR
ncbi:hypothetical protein Tco_0705457 [Tanacetum coccineum]|uniref:Uncharacterized protein n=1 Tax=Tanacetum coccineum TaxID=301880 RepID=A0ABQ4Y615_9ASTR